MNISNQYFVNYSNQLPTYEEFFNNVMKKNLVCLFNSNLTENWICRKEWIIDDQINFSFLSKNYGLILMDSFLNFYLKFLFF